MPSLPFCFCISVYLYYVRTLYIRTQVLNLLILIPSMICCFKCVYICLFTLVQCLDFHLPTTISSSGNFHATGTTEHSDSTELRNIRSDHRRTGCMKKTLVVVLVTHSTWVWCDVLEIITTSLSERLRRIQHPSAMPAVWINWTSLDNCCRHSQQWVSSNVRPYLQPGAAIPTLRRGMYHNIVCFFPLCVLLSNGYWIVRINSYLTHSLP
jgi:hypothetical protein